MTQARRASAQIVGPAHLAGAAFDRAPLFVITAEDHTVVEANRAARQRLCRGGDTQVSLFAHVPEHQWATLADGIATCLETRETTQVVADWSLAEGGHAPVELTLSPIERADGDRVVALAGPPAPRSQAGLLVGKRQQILEMIARHLQLAQVLSAVETLVAHRFPRAFTATVVRDAVGVRVLGGERLPAAYRAHLREAASDANEPLGAALASNEPVIITDVAADHRWGAAAAPLASAGIGSLWVTPFAEGYEGACAACMLHFAEPATPDDVDLDGLHEAAQLARLALTEDSTSRQLFERAYLDPITRLPNRRLLDDRLGQTIERARRHGELVAVFVVEALLRWQHPVEGLLPPGQFLPQAEASDLVCELDQWLWTQAAADLDWLARHGHRPKLSLNISPRDLQNGDFATRLLETLAASGLPPRRCELEITENVLMPDVAHARAQLHALKRLAPELAIVVDDFGTGYASLNYLRELPIDGLKIDRSFIDTRAVEDSSTAQAIARTVAELGHQLGLRVTAEGVEQADQRALACAIGCDRLQGFLYARAMDRTALRDYLALAAETASATR